MRTLAPTHRGYGISTRTRDHEFQLLLNPRGELLIRDRLLWTPSSLRVELPAMLVPEDENPFERQRDLAIRRLQQLSDNTTAALGALGRVLGDLDAWSLSIEPSLICLRFLRRPSEIERFVEPLARIADTLNDGRSTELHRSVHGFRSDAPPEHRLYDLVLLVKRFRESSETSRALADACRDDDLGLRLFAAKAAGTSGLATLADIALNARLDSSARRDALDAFCARATNEGRRHLLATLCRAEDRTMAAAAMDALDRDPADVVVPLMLSVVEAGDAVLAPAAARKLARFAKEPSRFEPRLLELLAAPLSDSAYFAIVDVLGDVGTTAALPTLQRALRGTFFNAQAKTALRTAIETLKQRHLVAEPGAVSLLNGTGGEVSRERE